VDKKKDNLFKYFFQLYKKHFIAKKLGKYIIYNTRPIVETSRESRKNWTNQKDIRIERNYSFSLDTKLKSSGTNLIETFMDYLKDKVPNQVLVNFIFIQEEFQEHFSKEIQSFSKEHYKNIDRSPNINTIHPAKKSLNHSRNLDNLFKISGSKPNLKETYANKEQVKKKEVILSISPSPNEKKQFFKRIHKGLKFGVGLNKTNVNKDNSFKINISTNIQQKKNAISNYSSNIDTNPAKNEKSKKVVVPNTPKNYVFNHNLRGYLNKNKRLDEKVNKLVEKKQNKEDINKKIYSSKDSNPSKGKVNRISPCKKPLVSVSKENETLKKYIHQNKFCLNKKEQPKVVDTVKIE